MAPKLIRNVKVHENTGSVLNKQMVPINISETTNQLFRHLYIILECYFLHISIKKIILETWWSLHLCF